MNKVIVSLLFLVCCSSASDNFIDVKTGLTWLDISSTIGHSYNTNIANAASGVTGATEDQVATMLWDYKIAGFNTDQFMTDFGIADAIASQGPQGYVMFGTTSLLSPGSHLQTYDLMMPDNTLCPFVCQLYTDITMSWGPGFAFNPDWIPVPPSIHQHLSTWLIETTPTASAVPEPSTAILLASGLLVLGGAFRKKKRVKTP